MIWDDGDRLFWQAWYDVWTCMAVTYVWPARIVSAWHTSRSLARRCLPPVARSWLGVGNPTPSPLTECSP